MAIVRYLVNDVDEAIVFYEQLGFTIKERWGPPFAIINRDDLDIWLSGPQTSAAKAMPDGAKPVAGGWNRFVIGVTDIEATVQTLREAGYSFRNEILTGTGGKQILAEDPSGNPIELFESQ